MPKINTLDNSLNQNSEGKDFANAFSSHGVEFRNLKTSTDGQLNADCIWCHGRKWYVNRTNGQWDCKQCGRKGNLYGFLEQLLETSLEVTTDDDYEALVKRRAFLSSEPLKAWKAALSVTTGEWIIPAYNPKGNLSNLSRYVEVKEGKHDLYGTPGCAQHLYGVHLYDPRKVSVSLCEGPWDAMALWEVLKYSRLVDVNHYQFTNQLDQAILAGTNVLAVPSASTFKQDWSSLFDRKEVTLYYDSDHPKRPCITCKKSYSIVGRQTCPGCGKPSSQKVQTPAGWQGMQKVVQILCTSDTRPQRLSCVVWGDGGYDAQKPSGYDVRDFLKEGTKLATRIGRYGELSDKVRAVPSEWVPGHGPNEETNEFSTQVPLIHCKRWQDLVEEWKIGMKVTTQMEYGLSAILAAGMGKLLRGDPVWLTIMSPPSTGKSTLCFGMNLCEKHVKQVDTLRGFHSGYQSDKEGDEDHSLIEKIRNMIMITKDGDTLMQSVNLPQILSEARGLFDGSSSAQYRNKRSQVYKDVYFVWLVFGTGSLKELDESELGQRFLRVRLVRSIDPEMEDMINLKNIYQMLETYRKNPAINGEGSDGKAVLPFQQMLGGYTEYLCDNAVDLVRPIAQNTEIEMLNRVKDYGKLVAYMRARPPKKQKEELHRELSTRLVNQFGKLALCMAAVLNQPSVNDMVLERVRSVALDSAEGMTLNLALRLYTHGTRGCHLKEIADSMEMSNEECEKLLRFLRLIQFVERYRPLKNKIPQQARYRLSTELRSIIRSVYDAE